VNSSHGEDLRDAAWYQPGIPRSVQHHTRTVSRGRICKVIRCIVVPSTFKRRLKTELFSRAYDVSLDISDVKRQTRAVYDRSS